MTSTTVGKQILVIKIKDSNYALLRHTKDRPRSTAVLCSVNQENTTVRGKELLITTNNIFVGNKGSLGGEVRVLGSLLTEIRITQS